MSVRRTWLPREGFTADVVGHIVKNTALNPALTLPLLLVAHYTRKGQDFSIRYTAALKWLKILLYIGIARSVNGFLSRGSQDNWKKAKYDWIREVVIITGGSDGIGKHISWLLAEKGCKIASLDIQPPTFEPRPNIYHFTCDITSPEAVTETAASIRSTLGHPTILINNAGTASGLAIINSSDAAVQRVFDVNILSHFRLVREFLPSMVKANHGTVVTVASTAAVGSTPQIVDYCCTKAAALSFHEGLAAELATIYNAPKVRTVCVMPNWTETSMTKTVKVADKFLMPMQKVETVAEKVVQKILSGSSGIVLVPEAAAWLAWPLRAMPMWWQNRLRHRAGRLVGNAMRPEKAAQMVEQSQS
ncbi:MAG: hypothetical protein Q9191_002281 [Dirinaria sp. TL-2023a]